ncbi:MAG: nucleotide-binding protein [Promethearchaeota archaeon]
MKIAVAGKGGVGKTFIAGTLSHIFAEDGYKVLAVDNDPSMNLSFALGIPEDVRDKLVPISKMLDLVEERTGVKPGASDGVYSLTPRVSDIPDKYKVEGPNGVQLLVLGTIEEPSTGCLCSSNVLVRNLLYELIVERKEVVIVDFEAGLEHLGRGTARGVDIMAVVTEPSQKSFDLSKRVIQLADEMGVRNVFAILNKIQNEEEERVMLEKFEALSVFVIGTVRRDPNVRACDLKGESLYVSNPNSPAVEDLRKIYEKIKKLEKTL